MSPFLTKKDDLGMPSIQCSINWYNFYKMLCDTGLGVNIIAAVTYELLFGTITLKLTYIQLQMTDQTFRKVEGIVTDVPIKIDNHFVHTDFQVIDIGEGEYDPPIVLGRPFLSTVKPIIYIGTRASHSPQKVSKEQERYVSPQVELDFHHCCRHHHHTPFISPHMHILI